MFVLGMLYHVALECGLDSRINRLIVHLVGFIPEFKIGEKLFNLGWIKAGQWFY